MVGPQQRNCLIPPTPEEVARRSAEQAKHRDELRALMRALHATVLTEFGDEEGRREWQRTNNKPRGRAKGPTQPKEDRFLLTRPNVAAQRGQPKGPLHGRRSDYPFPAPASDSAPRRAGVPAAPLGASRQPQ
jgi:hypothetical protein